VFLGARTGALLRWLVLAVLALRRTRRLAPHPVLFAIVTFISGQVLREMLSDFFTVVVNPASRKKLGP
jgi:hypothetical protein